MARLPGREKIKVELNFDPLKMLDPGARRAIERFPDIKKAFAKPVKWSETVEADPTKYDKKELDYQMELVARWPYQIVATYLSDAISKGGKELEQAKKEALKDLAEAQKIVPKRCAKKLEDLVSGKEDNAKAIKRMDSAFELAEGADFGGAFEGPRSEISKALGDLAKALKGRGDKEKALKDARDAIEKAKEDFEQAGAEGQDAIDYLLKTARQMKSDNKADAALKEVGKLIEADKGTFGAFEAKSDAFTKALADLDKLMDEDEPDAAAVERLKGEFDSLSGLDSAAQKVQAALKKIKAKYEDIKKELARRR